MSRPKVPFLRSNGMIRVCVKLTFVVLNWDGDTFLSEDTPKFLYNVRNGFMLTSWNMREVKFLYQIFPWRALSSSLPKERLTAVRLGAEYLRLQRRPSVFTLGSIDSQVSWGSGWQRSSTRGVEIRFSFLDVDKCSGLEATYIGVLRRPEKTGVFCMEIFGNI